ncbi:MAG: hypothetical protein M1165_02745, partial [Candidatus Pacearchaeota archaeon]|nr:hypothetical protein [Candidatus Pacearchaeota archaeon]
NKPSPSEGSLLVAQPIGNQQGLGLLGFCYVPYHFVYDVKYPVLVTLQRGSEIFQFPFAVVIQGNEPRTSLVGNATSVSAPVLCQNENTNMTVSVQDSNSNPVDANISYECFGETCSIGETASGSINALFPQCVNGYVLASAPGFVTGKYQLTTTQSGSISVVLNKLYNESVDLQIDGKEYTGNMALITFTSSDGSSQTINYPAQKSIGLSEGDYTIQVSAYDNSSINLGATTGQQCINVAGNAAEGALGVTQQQCFSVNVPSQVISSALSGGGQAETYIFESDLQNSNAIRINAQSLPAPTTIAQLQNNYVLLENKTLSVNFA